MDALAGVDMQKHHLNAMESAAKTQIAGDILVALADSEAQLQEVLAQIEDNAGYPLLDLPLMNEYFIDLGFDHLETDVHASAGGELYAFHDTHLGRVAGVEAAIGDLTSDEIDALRRQRCEPTFIGLLDDQCTERAPRFLWTFVASRVDQLPRFK